MKKILYLSPGFFHAREALFIALSEQFDIKIIEASSRINGIATEEYLSKVKTETWKYSHFRLSGLKLKEIPQLIHSVYKELKNGHYDLVISSTQHPFYAKVVSFLKPFFKYELAYVNEAWSYSHKKQTLFSRLYDKMSMNAVKKADYVLNEGIASTQFMISQGISPEKCHLWPMSSVDLSTKAIVASEELRKSFEDVPSGVEVKYAYIGRQTEPKGVLTLLEAFENLDQEHQKKSMLYFVGRGPLSEILIQKSKENQNIRVLNWVDSKSLPYVYSQLDFFINPSHFDGFSTVACEAASMSLPLILTDKVGGVPDIMGTDGVYNDFIVPTKDSQSLSRAITLMIDTPHSKRKEMGETFRHNFMKNTGIDVNIQTMKQIAL